MIIISNVSYSFTLTLCEMSKDDGVCPCKHDDTNIEISTTDIRISAEHNVCCEFFVKDYSNTSNFRNLENTNYNNISIVNHFPVILKLGNYKAVLNFHSTSYNNFHIKEIPILYSSLLIKNFILLFSVFRFTKIFSKDF